MRVSSFDSPCKLRPLMLRPAPIHASQEARAYLESHGVPDAISTAVAGILKDRPEEPVTAIAKAMLAAEESVRKRNLHPFAALFLSLRGAIATV